MLDTLCPGPYGLGRYGLGTYGLGPYGLGTYGLGPYSLGTYVSGPRGLGSKALNHMVWDSMALDPTAWEPLVWDLTKQKRLSSQANLRKAKRHNNGLQIVHDSCHLFIGPTFAKQQNIILELTVHTKCTIGFHLPTLAPIDRHWIDNKETFKEIDTTRATCNLAV